MKKLSLFKVIPVKNGRITIPVAIRKRFGIVGKWKASVISQNNRILVIPTGPC